MSTSAPVGVGEQPRLLDGDARHLADGQELGVAAGEDLPVHLLQELVDPRAAQVDGPPSPCRCPRRTAPSRQRRALGDHVDDVHAEAVDAPVEPPAHHRVDRGADLGVLPVEVGLLAARTGAGSTRRSPRRTPGGPGEERPPVGRLRARRRPGSFPRGPGATSTSPAWGCRATSATPWNHGVLVGGVVDHEVHDELHAALVDPGEQLVEVRERPEHRVDVAVVADVVAVVVLRRRVDRREPEHVDAEARRGSRGGPVMPARSPIPSPSLSAKLRG